MTYRVGYVVKRFPRVSETFIAQEILQLEAFGAEVTILALQPNDAPAGHAWLSRISAKVVPCDALPLSNAWKWLHREATTGHDRGPRCQQALAESFGYPDRRGRHRLREAVVVAQTALVDGIDHLHAHFANEPAFVAYLAHLMTGIPFSFTAHAKDIYAKALTEETLNRVVAHSAFAVTVSEDNRRHLTGRLEERLGRKILRLYNGVDLDAFRPSQPRRAGFGILCVARLIEKKGVDVLLRALAALERRGIDFHCTVLGDGPLRQKLEALADVEGVSRRLVWKGAVDQEQVVDALGTHDVLVLPARVASDGDQDALPTVLLEAMASGLPCISTPIGGIPEIVSHRSTGLIVPCDRPIALADAIAEIETHPELASRMGREARRRAEALFDRIENVAQLHAWFGRSADGEPVFATGPTLRVVES